MTKIFLLLIYFSFKIVVSDVTNYPWEFCTSTNAAECSKKTWCQIEGSQCVIKEYNCYHIEIQKKCLKKWCHMKSGSCTYKGQSCYTISNHAEDVKKECATNKYCTFESDFCLPKGYFCIGMDKKECAKNKWCAFEDGECFPNGYLCIYLDKEKCSKDKRCIFNDGECFPKAHLCNDIENKKDCNAKGEGKACAFENEECIPNDESCSILSSPNKCYKATRTDDHNWNCVWDTDADVFVEESCITGNDYCKKYGKRSSIFCDEILFCHWDKENKICKENPKSGF